MSGMQGHNAIAGKQGFQRVSGAVPDCGELGADDVSAGGSWTPPPGAGHFVVLCEVPGQPARVRRPLADVVNELGWVDAILVRLKGEAQYDDQDYFTPTWELAVRPDAAVADLEDVARQAALMQAAADGLEDDDLDDYLDDYGSLTRALDEVAVAHWRDAGVLFLDTEADPFEERIMS